MLTFTVKAKKSHKIYSRRWFVLIARGDNINRSHRVLLPHTKGATAPHPGCCCPTPWVPPTPHTQGATAPHPGCYCPTPWVLLPHTLGTANAPPFIPITNNTETREQLGGPLKADLLHGADLPLQWLPVGWWRWEWATRTHRYKGAVYKTY